MDSCLEKLELEVHNLGSRVTVVEQAQATFGKQEERRAEQLNEQAKDISKMRVGMATVTSELKSFKESIRLAMEKGFKDAWRGIDFRFKIVYGLLSALVLVVLGNILVNLGKVP